MPRVREGVMSVTVEAAQMSPKRLRTDPAQNLESKEEDARGMADPREGHWWTLGGGHLSSKCCLGQAGILPPTHSPTSDLLSSNSS